MLIARGNLYPPSGVDGGLRMGVLSRFVEGAAAAAPTFQAAGTVVGVASTGTVSPAWPTHQADDIALLIVESNFGAAITLSDAQGFVEVTSSPQSIDGLPTGGTQLSVFWCRATSAAMASPTVNDPGSGDNHRIAQILTFRGCATSGSPWDTVVGDTGTDSTSVSVPGGTTTTPNCLVVAICTHGTDTATAQFSSWANADLASADERTDVANTSGHGGGFGVATGVKASAGAFGATTATLASSSVQARLTIALKP